MRVIGTRHCDGRTGYKPSFLETPKPAQATLSPFSPNGPGGPVIANSMIGGRIQPRHMRRMAITGLTAQRRVFSQRAMKVRASCRIVIEDQCLLYDLLKNYRVFQVNYIPLYAVERAPAIFKAPLHAGRKAITIRYRVVTAVTAVRSWFLSHSKPPSFPFLFFLLLPFPSPLSFCFHR